MQPILLGLFITIGVLWFDTTQHPGASLVRERLNNLFYDMHMRINIIQNKPKESNIMIVDINDETMNKMGRWPWPRDTVATLIDILREQGAAVIAMDIVFPEAEKNMVDSILERAPSHTLSPETIHDLIGIKPSYDHDNALAKAIATPDVVAGYILTAEKGQHIGTLPPPLETLSPDKIDHVFVREMSGYIGITPVLAASAQSTGFVTTLTDDDGVIRHYPVVLEYQNAIYPSLALSAVKQYLLLNEIKLNWVNIGNDFSLSDILFGTRKIHTDGSGQVLIPYRNLQNIYNYVSAEDIFARKNDPKFVHGKIVFIGTSAAGLGDLHTTPIETSFPGVEIHATVADTLLSGKFPYKPDWAIGAQISLIIFVGIVFSVLLPFMPVWLTIFIPMVCMTALLYLDDMLWDHLNLYLPFFSAVLNIFLITVFALMHGFIFETRKRSQLKHMFGQYIPPEQVEKMSDSNRNYGFEGESREMTVLFADIRNFTGISEHMDPTVLKKFLNDFFTPMTKSIFEHNGTIDKYVGDMIMAFWGAPLENPHHALDAVKTGFEMLRIATTLKENFDSIGVRDLHIGIGINTGKMNVGDMGSEYRRSYTVLGDSVNLASRLESSTKFYGTYFIISEHTLKECKGEVVCRHLDRVKVKGKIDAIDIYEPICMRDQLTSEIKTELGMLTEAQHHYFQAEWDQAIAGFEALNQAFPGHKLYELYVDRIKAMKDVGITAPWDGCFVRDEK